MKVTRRKALLIMAGAVASILGYKYLLDLFWREEVGPREGKVLPEHVVCVAKGGEGRELVRRAVEGLGGLSGIVKSGDRVVVKPNVGFPVRDAVTSPEVVAELVEMAYEAGAGEVLVVESSVRGSDTTYCFRETGYFDALKPLGVEIVDLKRSGTVITVRCEDAYRLKTVDVYEEAYDADVLISVAKMKRHVSADVTLGMKNLIGCFPDWEKGRFHREGLHECIADIAHILKPDLVVVDGTTAMTKRGPTGGVMVPAEVVVASRDPLACDYVAAKILFELEGVKDPASRAMKVKYFQYAAQLGVGLMGEEVEVVMG